MSEMATSGPGAIPGKAYTRNAVFTYTINLEYTKTRH
jgi:hypothetical protein